MRKIKSRFSTITFLIGVLLLAASIALLLFSQMKQTEAARDTAKAVMQLCNLVPEVHDEIADDRVNMTMPAMEVEGISFCGIIEVPIYNTELPIRESWDKSSALSVPCKYLGSIYDGSLIIGGSDKKGQFDFMQQITNGDCVYITDMVGGKYSYMVSVVKKSSDVSTNYLTGIDADLVLFARNTYSMDYTVVGCTLGN